MNAIKVFPIEKIINKGKKMCVKLDSKYAAGLMGLEDYSHALILWWADGCDNEKDRDTVTEEKPYKNGPGKIGVFVLRSPERPNPVAVSNIDIAYVNTEKGEIGFSYIDAFDGSKVLDIKPYTPSFDRIGHPKTTSWCNHWPKSYEESGSFDWEAEFNF